ncbi:hypothetical protein [Rhodococcus spelaei]|uniref:hypothetical protein n=1 Tax=Rhodococcus spelaei TaxID=2546320 RepID=UPI0015EEB9DD|nr:hypothetical protein [Rhodococcus spelaei]
MQARDLRGELGADPRITALMALAENASDATATDRPADEDDDGYYNRSILQRP